MFRQLFFAAVLAGLVAGGLMAAVHQWRVTPLIQSAEFYEKAPVHDHGGAAPDAGAAEHDHAAEGGAWAPADGPERMFYTVLADVLVSMGFALILGAVAYVAGIPLTATNGVVWGIAGFVAFSLAPAFGLPPELPGMPVADLVPRQIWWWETVLLTAAAALVLAKMRPPLSIGLAAVLAILPHLMGAPHPPAGAQSEVPAELASAFAASTLAASALFWLSVGPLLGYLLERFARSETAR